MPSPDREHSYPKLSRRRFLEGIALAGGAALGACAAQKRPETYEPAEQAELSQPTVIIPEVSAKATVVPAEFSPLPSMGGKSEILQDPLNESILSQRTILPGDGSVSIVKTGYIRPRGVAATNVKVMDSMAVMPDGLVARTVWQSQGDAVPHFDTAPTGQYPFGSMVWLRKNQKGGVETLENTRISPFIQLEPDESIFLNGVKMKYVITNEEGEAREIAVLPKAGRVVAKDGVNVRLSPEVTEGNKVGGFSQNDWFTPTSVAYDTQKQLWVQLTKDSKTVWVSGNPAFVDIAGVALEEVGLLTKEKPTPAASTAEKTLPEKVVPLTIEGTTVKPSWNDEYQTWVWEKDGKIVRFYEKLTEEPMAFSRAGRLICLTQPDNEFMINIDGATPASIEATLNEWATKRGDNISKTDKVYFIYQTDGNFQTDKSNEKVWRGLPFSIVDAGSFIYPFSRKQENGKEELMFIWFMPYRIANDDLVGKQRKYFEEKVFKKRLTDEEINSKVADNLLWSALYFGFLKPGHNVEDGKNIPDFQPVVKQVKADLTPIIPATPKGS